MERLVKTKNDPGETSHNVLDRDFNVLLVDDDPSFLELSERYFEKYGSNFNLQTADSPEKALELLEEGDIECVISDYQMPEMTGVELLEQVHMRFPELPFIILTSEGNEEIASEAISQGVTDYIKKKGDVNQYRLIIRRVKNAVLKNRAEMERRAERRDFEQTLTQLHRASQDLLEAETREEASQLILETTVNVLGMPGAGVYLYNNQENKLEPVAISDRVRQIFDQVPYFEESDESITLKAFEEQKIIQIDELGRDDPAYTYDTPLKSGVWAPIGGYGVLAMVSEQVSGYDEKDRQLIELLASTAETALERIEKQENFERTIEEINSVARDAFSTDDLTQISERVAETAVKILDAKGAVIYRKEGDKLVPEGIFAAEFMRDEFPELPVDSSSLTGHAFEDGEIMYCEDIRESEHIQTEAREKTKMRSGIFAPIGENRVMVIGSTEIREFAAQTRKIVQILVSGSEVAFKRIDWKKSLEDNRQKYQTLLENFPNGAVALYDRDLRYEVAKGETIEKIYGSEDEIVGKTVDEIYSSEVLEKLKTCFEAALEGNKSRCEIKLDDLHLNVQTLPIKDSNGDVIAGMAMSQDISDRKKGEEEIKLFENIIESMEDGIYVLDKDWNFIMVNQAYADMVGRSKDELLGLKATEVVSNDIAEESWSKLETLEEGESATLEAEMKTADGRELIGESRFTKLVDETGDFIGKLGVVRDITGKKKMEDKLRKMQKESQAMVDSMVGAVEDYAIFRLKPDGTVATWNDGAEKIKGYSEDEIVGENFSVFYTDEDIEAGAPEQNLHEARINDAVHTQGWRLKKDGGRFWADVTITAIRDDEGELQGFTKITRDMTRKKFREDELDRKLEEFSSIVSHDLKNPLEIARGYMNLANTEGDIEEIQKAENALDQMEKIIEDLRIITKEKASMETEKLSLEEIFSEAFTITNISEASYEVENKVIEGSRTSVVRLFTNLITNSIEHNTKKVHLTAGPLENGFYYQDDGSGISEGTRQKIMEKGFTTSDTGSGLGLYIVKRIAELHNWNINVVEPEEGGVRFEFTAG